MSLTEAGTASVELWMALKTSMVIKQLRQGAVHMEHMARLEGARETC